MELSAADLVKVMREDIPSPGLSPGDLKIISDICLNSRWRQTSDETLRIRIQNMRLAAAAEENPGQSGSWNMR